MRSKFAGKPAAEEAIADWTANPQEQYVQSAFVHQLRKVCEADPTFAAELARLLTQAQPASQDILINIGSGAIATDKGVAAGAGGFANKGNIYGNVTVGEKDKKG